MIKILSGNIIRFIFLALLQVLVLDNINLGGYINPFLYVLFILLLPFETPKAMLLIFAFAMGLTIDIFNDSLGLHCASLVLMAYLRPVVLGVIAPRDGYDPGSFPRVYYFGLNWYLRYSILLVTIHHTTYYFLEAFSFENFIDTLLKIILSTIFSLFLIILSQYLIYRKV